MGWWGERAKDGDSPMDLWEAWKMGNYPQTPSCANEYLRNKLHELSERKTCGFDYLSLFGCATLMIEGHYPVKPEILKEIWDKAYLNYSESRDRDELFCEDDERFYNAYMKGVTLTKVPHVVKVEIYVDAFDEKDALLEASKRVDRLPHCKDSVNTEALGPLNNLKFNVEKLA